MFPEGGSTAWDHGTPAYPTHAPQPAIPTPSPTPLRTTSASVPFPRCAAACSLVTAPGSKACASIRCAFAPSAPSALCGRFFEGTARSRSLRQNAGAAPGLGSPVPHLHRDRARPCHICTGIGLARATSDSGMGSPVPHLHLDGAHPCHICTGTGLSPATCALGLRRAEVRLRQHGRVPRVSRL